MRSDQPAKRNSPANISLTHLRALTPAQRQKFLNQLSADQMEYIRTCWPLFARPKQTPPDGKSWRIWLLLAGRGFGKTRAGAEWIRAMAESGKARQIALVGQTIHDVRQVMVEGPSGLLAIAPKWARPRWFPSRRLLIWPNGARASTFAAEAPDQLRGPEFDYGWADEIAKWPNESAWHNLMLALRLGAHNPQGRPASFSLKPGSCRYMAAANPGHRLAWPARGSRVYPL